MTLSFEPGAPLAPMASSLAPAPGTGRHRPWPDVRPVGLDSARAAGRVQAGLIGAKRLGIACGRGDAARVLLVLAARALGHERVVALHDARDASPDDTTLAELAGTLGVRLVAVPFLGAGVATDAPEVADLDTVAYPDTADVMRRAGRPAVRAATPLRVLYPLAEAGLGKADLDRLADALGCRAASS